MASPTLDVTDRTTLRRLPERGSYDRDVVDAILDEGLVCHLGFVDGGQPFVIPTTYARVDDVVYVHGSAASRTLRTLDRGVDVCLTVTLLDGLVLARSAFHHSMNYRCVVLMGRAEKVEDEAEKQRALAVIVDHVVPGRSEVARATTPAEARKTFVLRLAIDEGSAKVRTGDAIDDEDDLGLPVWAGQVPLRLVAGDPIPNQDLTSGL